MATKLVCLLISTYLLLAGDYHVVSGFTPVIYSSESSSTECGQSDVMNCCELFIVQYILPKYTNHMTCTVVEIWDNIHVASGAYKGKERATNTIIRA